MTSSDAESGVLAVLIERLEKQRLPRALALKEKVDKGEILDDFDIAFLQDVFADSSRIKPVIEHHPEYHSLAAKMVSLYHEITERALANQQKSGAD
jgi:hypothetical protein